MRNWTIERTTYRASDFIQWQRSKMLVLSPNFQRRPVWNPATKSYFIDTMVRGLPIPLIFLRDQRTDLATLEVKREVVDGQQRIRTILSYIDPSLLADFNPNRDSFVVLPVHNEELGNKQFTELPDELKQRILDYQFSVHILPSDIDDREVLQIFARMNSTGVKLNPQELRNAKYFAEFKTSMYRLASEQLPKWRNWRVFTEDNIARMEEVELVSEFALLMLRGISGKTQAGINQIYKEKDPNYQECSEVEHRFRTVMDTIDDRVGNELRFLPFRKKTLFYSLFALFYDLLYGMNSPLERTRQRVISLEAISRTKFAGDKIQNKTAPEEVLNAAARRTTHPSSRNIILNYLKTEVQRA